MLFTNSICQTCRQQEITQRPVRTRKSQFHPTSLRSASRVSNASTAVELKSLMASASITMYFNPSPSFLIS